MVQSEINKESQSAFHLATDDFFPSLTSVCVTACTYCKKPRSSASWRKGVWVTQVCPMCLLL